MNIFEQATRKRYRYPSIKGEITTEQLWELSLTHRSGFDLDSVAKEINRQLKDAEEESFVATKANPVKEALTIKLEVVKHIIGVKLAEQQAAKDRSAAAEKRQRLQEVLHSKQNAALENLSEEEIQKQLAELGDE